MNQNAESETVSSIGSKALTLPSTVQGLLDMRKTPYKQSLNDQVDQLHVQLWANKDYRRLWDAVYPEQAVEGSLIADDFEIARLIRKQAGDSGNTYVATQKLDTLRKTAGVVSRRYRMSRRARRNWLA